MKSDAAARLLALNREFYARFGESFSATRRRLQPGVRRVLDSLRGDESILDLGCGNGELARELGRRGHRGPYLGLDFSPALLREAQARPRGFAAAFREADLTRLPDLGGGLFPPDGSGGWDRVTLFAVLHHIPGEPTRLALVRALRLLMKPAAELILSNWQFLNSPRLRARIQPWSRAGLTDGEVEPGDYLLDWRRDGAGLRYVHHFSAGELESLAAQAGLRVAASFASDGEHGRLGLYQVWQAA